MGAVVLRVDGVTLPVRDVDVHPDYRVAADDGNDVGEQQPSSSASSSSPVIECALTRP